MSPPSCPTPATRTCPTCPVFSVCTAAWSACGLRLIRPRIPSILVPPPRQGKPLGSIGGGAAHQRPPATQRVAVLTGRPTPGSMPSLSTAHTAWRKGIDHPDRQASRALRHRGSRQEQRRRGPSRGVLHALMHEIVRDGLCALPTDLIG